jgi:hypothetical protein
MNETLHTRFGKLAVGAALVGSMLLSAAAAGASSARPAAVKPGTIYMTDFVSDSALYRVNATNGAATRVGYTGVQLTDLAFKGSTLYAVGFSTLYKINPTTAQATTVGSLHRADVNALVANPTNGKLYGAGSNSGGFVSISSTTGQSTQIGTFGPGLTSAGDLVFIKGVLYASVNRQGYSDTWLVRVNVTTGTAKLIGDLGSPDVWGLALRSGTLYGATREGNWLRISPSNGHATVIGHNSVQQAGLTTAP